MIKGSNYWKLYEKIKYLCLILFISFLLPTVCVNAVSAFAISRYFDVNTAIIYNPNIEWFYNHLPLSLIIYFINIIINLCFCINIGLILCKKNRNFVVCCSASLFLWVVIDFLTEIVCGFYIANIIFKKSYVQELNLFAIYSWNIPNRNLIPLVFSAVLFFISLIALYFTYYNKETVFYEIEK